MKFTLPRRIRFSDCDPAGIVFYPQYFVMFNDLLEQWVDALLPEGFSGYILGSRRGLPTVSVQAEFREITRMGEDVVLCLGIERLGSRSISLILECRGADGQLRMSCKQTVVTTSLETHESMPVPTHFRQALAPYLPGAEILQETVQ